MKISKGKINNINKKILTGTIVLTVINASFAGCSSVQSFQYSTNEQGEIVVEGTFDYDYLKECYFVEIENPDYDTIEYYIARKTVSSIGDAYGYARNYYASYSNVMTGNVIYKAQSEKYDGVYVSFDDESNRNLVKEIKLGDYLYSLDKIKDTYSKEDVENILEDMKILNNDKIKELVKE